MAKVRTYKVHFIKRTEDATKKTLKRAHFPHSHFQLTLVPTITIGVVKILGAVHLSVFREVRRRSKKRNFSGVSPMLLVIIVVIDRFSRTPDRYRLIHLGY